MKLKQCVDRWFNPYIWRYGPPNLYILDDILLDKEIVSENTGAQCKRKVVGMVYYLLDYVQDDICIPGWQSP